MTALGDENGKSAPETDTARHACPMGQQHDAPLFSPEA
jgi:hypothetical protein